MRRLISPRSWLAAGSLASFGLASARALSEAAAPPVAPRAAVVVGVSHEPGLGFAIAKRFAEGGMNVGIIGRQGARLEACKASILASAPAAQITCYECDATDPAAVGDAFAALERTQGKADALVYNLSARPFPPTPISELTPERLESDWKTGPWGALLCTKAVLPAMQEAGRGTILITGASASLRGSARFGSFGCAKGSLRSFAQSLAKEVSGQGIHVAHVVIDCMVDMPVIHQFVPDAAPGRMLDTAAAAEMYWQLYQQDKRCMAFEVDLRPFEAQW